MANHSRKGNFKSNNSRQNQKNNRNHRNNNQNNQKQLPTSAIQLYSKKSEGKKKWLSSLFVIGILFGSVALLTAFICISFLFIFEPDKLTTLNNVLPSWAQLPIAKRQAPQTIEKIYANIKKQGYKPGEKTPLEEEGNKSFLLPIFHQRPNCFNNCEEISEIRVYENATEKKYNAKSQVKSQLESQDYYYQTFQLSIQGPDESFVVAPLAAAGDNAASSVPLSLNTVGRFDDTPSPGIWLYVRGDKLLGSGQIAYGHIIHYNPERNHLQMMLSWSSPNGELPQWQQVTGKADKELVINQTIGLEPQIRVYQVQPAKFFLSPVQLGEISLKYPGWKDSNFQKAIAMAKSGLWTPGYDWLQSIKKQHKTKIPEAALAQIDLIRLHSQATKTQANTSWASPSQQVLAYLIDGRWGEALKVFEASPDNSLETASLLNTDGGRLWNRVEAALKANPNQKEVQAWAALILSAQKGSLHANAWLKGQPKISKDSLTYIQSLLSELSGKGKITKNTVVLTHPTKIIGAVELIGNINTSEWLQPDSPKTSQDKPQDKSQDKQSKSQKKPKPNPNPSLQKDDSQKWYQIQVSAFSDGKRWQRKPLNLQLPKTNPGKYFWETLGLVTTGDNPIDMIFWQADGGQQTITATIKAAQLRGNVLRLLAAGESTNYKQPPNQTRPLALTSSALEWVQPSPTTISQLNQTNPNQVKILLPILWKLLSSSGYINPDKSLKFQQQLQKVAEFPVQILDLTANSKPETILTIAPEAIISLNKPLTKSFAKSPKAKGQEKNSSRPLTVILSDTGKVIYTDFGKNNRQALTAIAKLSDGQSPNLLVESGSGYSVLRWTEKSQRFE
jgi:hypothetical protein